MRRDICADWFALGLAQLPRDDTLPACVRATALLLPSHPGRGRDHSASVHGFHLLQRHAALDCDCQCLLSHQDGFNELKRVSSQNFK